jgi:hypothetical protein
MGNRGAAYLSCTPESDQRVGNAAGANVAGCVSSDFNICNTSASSGLTRFGMLACGVAGVFVVI